MPVNPLTLLFTSAITPSPSGLPPGAKLHCPTPINGEVPLKVAPVPQIVWGPADDEVVGFASKRICTSSVLAVHTPLLIVQRNIYVSPALPVKLLLKVPGAMIDPPTPTLPGAKLHAPVPTAIGLLPAKVVLVKHNVWSPPAADTVGA